MASDPAVVLAVLGQVGVQQVQRNAADLGAPDARQDVAARKRRGDHDWLPILIEQRPQRYVPRLKIVVVLALVARAVDRLAEVAVAVEQPDAHQWQAEVARRLEVITSKHAEPARIDWQAIGNRKLSGEIGDARRTRNLRRPCQVLSQVALEREQLRGVCLEPTRIAGDVSHDGDRVVGRLDCDRGLRSGAQRSTGPPAATNGVVA